MCSMRRERGRQPVFILAQEHARNRTFGSYVTKTVKRHLNTTAASGRHVVPINRVQCLFCAHHQSNSAIGDDDCATYVHVGGLNSPKTLSSYMHASVMKMTYMKTQAKPTL